MQQVSGKFKVYIKLYLSISGWKIRLQVQKVVQMQSQPSRVLPERALLSVSGPSVSPGINKRYLNRPPAFAVKVSRTFLGPTPRYGNC